MNFYSKFDKIKKCMNYHNAKNCTKNYINSVFFLKKYLAHICAYRFCEFTLSNECCNQGYIMTKLYLYFKSLPGFDLIKTIYINMK